LNFYSKEFCSFVEVDYYCNLLMMMIFLLHNLKKGFLKIACNAASYFCNDDVMNSFMLKKALLQNEMIH